MKNGKMWPVGLTTWQLQVFCTKTDAEKFCKIHGFRIVAEAFGEKNRPHIVVLKGEFKDTPFARSWAKENGFIVVKD